MSDQLIVEREGLEKKDKGELQAIVSALGGTSSSRARKSDLIDQIMELSADPADSVDPDDSDDSDGPADRDGSTAAPSAEAEPADSVEPPDPPPNRADTADDTADDSADDSGADDPAADHPVGPDGEPLADWEIQVLEEGGTLPGRGKGSRPGNGRKTSSRGDRKGQANDGGQESGGEARGERQERGGKGDRTNKSDQNGKNDQNGKTEAKSDQNGKGDTDGDDDGNNRRSRRRNRNRSKDRDDAPNDGVSNDPIEVEGYLDLRDEGYAFLRVNGFLPSREDAYVSVKQVRTHSLRKGDHVKGSSRPANRNEKNPALLQVNSINGRPPDENKGRPRFDKLTPLFPDQRLVLERPHEPLEMTTRIIDLVSPIGKGQRGLIVSPPKAGKTTIMKQIARSIETNNPEVELIVLLIDERPEEVTDMERHLERGEVVSSTFDRPPEEHTAVAELTLERAKRRVEAGNDVCIILDGITRLSRAYNLSAPQTGRVLSGGVDAAALYPPKRFLGAARNIEEGGSLTILATALVETGSRMDEVIFEEFKGTGNMELRLDRRLAEKRIFPAIDVHGSSTRNEELLRDRKEVEASWKLRKVVGAMGGEDASSSAAGIEMVVDRLKSFKTNAEFLAEISRSAV